jgi:hypothetical protein
MPEKPKDDWLKPKTHYTKSHVYRQRTRMERGMESVMRDFFGAHAPGEIEQHQGNAQEMKPIINDLLSEWRGDDSVALRTLVERWHEVIGVVYKKHTRPGLLENGVLHIEVFHAALLANLKHMEAEILEKVQALVGDEVTAIRVVPGGRSSR